MANFYVPLTDQELVALSRMAMEECRHPKEQARYMIRQALSCSDDDDLRKRIEKLESIITAMQTQPAPTQR